MNTPSEETQIIGQTPFLNLVQRGRWAYATRPNASGVVVIVPVTNDGKLIFVEQFRPPVNAKVLELPAGPGRRYSKPPKMKHWNRQHGANFRKKPAMRPVR